MHNSKYLDQGNKQYILANYKEVSVSQHIKFWVRHPPTWLQKVLQIACLSQLFILLTLILLKHNLTPSSRD